MQERHREYYVALAEEAAVQLIGKEQAQWLRRLEEEHENLRAALNWSLVAVKPEGGLRLCAALHRFWATKGYLSEGRDWCARFLGKAEGEVLTRERANALNTAGVLAQLQADYTDAHRQHEESLAIRRQLGDRSGIAGSLNNLANVLALQGEYASARKLYEESLAIRRQLGDRNGMAVSLDNLGAVANDQRDLCLPGR